MVKRLSSKTRYTKPKDDLRYVADTETDKRIMYVLGIETSCDETAAAIVRDGRKIISHEISSSLKEHQKYGGIVPEIAFRSQLETITQVADSAVSEAGISLNEIGLISVTSGPGLLGSLLVGIAFAKAVSFSLDIPLLGINHLYSHIYANFLNAGAHSRLPFVALVVSGGHTSLLYVKEFDNIEILGATLDDACGEAFDKVAKILGLGYPGGPPIEQLAKKGDAKKIKFQCSGTKRPFDFSFSGIKTAVLYAVNGKRLTVNDKRNIAASFQEAVIDTLVKKSLLACKLKQAGQLVMGGGVVANDRLRERFQEAAQKSRVNVYFPPRELCLDNAAMVAGLGYQLFKKGRRADLTLSTDLGR